MRVSVRAEEHNHHQVRGNHDHLRNRIPHHLHGLPLLHRPHHRQVEAEFIQAAEGGRGKSHLMTHTLTRQLRHLTSDTPDFLLA